MDISYYNYLINKNEFESIISSVSFSGKILMIGGIIINNDQGDDQFVILDSRVHENGVYSNLTVYSYLVVLSIAIISTMLI